MKQRVISVSELLESSCLCPQEEIEQVILVGGSTRVPKVQEVLLKAARK